MVLYGSVAGMQCAVINTLNTCLVVANVRKTQSVKE
jgi:hypothetical protein